MLSYFDLFFSWMGDILLFIQTHPEKMMEWGVQALIVLTGVAGQFYNIKQNRIGFIFWIVSNSTALLVSFFKGYYGMMILYFFYCLMCLYGLHEWKKKAPTPEKI